MLKVVPSHLEIMSLGVARTLRDYVFRHHRLPIKVISDCGPNFVSTFMQELYSLLGIASNASTAYHPQTDGQTERLNQEIKHFLHVFTNYHQSDWADWLALAEFSYNDKVQSSTGCSPFYLNYGQHPWKGKSPRREGWVEAAVDFANRMKEVHREAETSLKKAAGDMKCAYD